MVCQMTRNCGVCAWTGKKKNNTLNLQMPPESTSGEKMRQDKMSTAFLFQTKISSPLWCVPDSLSLENKWFVSAASQKKNVWIQLKPILCSGAFHSATYSKCALKKILSTAKSPKWTTHSSVARVKKGVENNHYFISRGWWVFFFVPEDESAATERIHARLADAWQMPSGRKKSWDAFSAF